MHQPIAFTEVRVPRALTQRPNPVEILHFLSESPEHLSIPAQQNERYVFTLFLRGSGVVTIDFNDHALLPHSLFFFEPHSMCALDTISETVLEGWRLSIHAAYLQQAGSNLSQLLFELRNTGGILLPEEKAHKLERMLYLLESELRVPSQDGGVVINAYLTILLSEIKRLSKPASVRSNHHDRRYDEFLELVNKDFRDIRDIEIYAARIHMSSKQLNRICKEISGQTAARLLEARIHLEASRLLHYTNRSVKEISYELGFGTPSYFIKFYRRVSHQTPLQYRQRMSGKQL